ELPKQTIQVPGSWEEQGYGDPSNHDSIGTWMKEQSYEGVAWYVKEVTIPASYEGRHMYLTINGLRFGSELWLDGVRVGQDESLTTPHRYDITRQAKPGATQRIVIRLDTHMRYDLDESHIHSYHTSTNWGGIDRKSTRLNSSHVSISSAVFCLKKKKRKEKGTWKITNLSTDLCIEKCRVGI